MALAFAVLDLGGSASQLGLVIGASSSVTTPLTVSPAQLPATVMALSSLAAAALPSVRRLERHSPV
ncbi:hypothetical protein [Arsenicicoccus bolidensis]|uniref:hypothetical protein n=1 Tax=Arsenicicoccus bolidensis TaxID=229480 RepID=UPI0028A9C411|nr:hypothetical protein [Arsenicicoccus bolidensis]